MGSEGVATMAKEPETEVEATDNNEALSLVYMARLARRVREARRHLKLKQSELGAMIGSNQSYIHLIEASQGNVTLKNLVRLGAALDLKPENLLMPDQVLPLLDETKIQQLALLTEISIHEMRSTMSNMGKIDQILQQLHALLTQHAESLKATSISES